MTTTAPSKTRTSLSPSDSGILRHFAKLVPASRVSPVHSLSARIGSHGALSRLHASCLNEEFTFEVFRCGYRRPRVFMFSLSSRCCTQSV